MDSSSLRDAGTQHLRMAYGKWGSVNRSLTPSSTCLEETIPLILAGKDEAKMKRVKEELASEFNIKDLGISRGETTTIMEDDTLSLCALTFHKVSFCARTGRKGDDQVEILSDERDSRYSDERPKSRTILLFA